MLPLLRRFSPSTRQQVSVRARRSNVRHSAGKPRSRHNIRQDLVDAVVAHANRLIEERGLQPLPLGITAHKLRRTFAWILVSIGKDPT